MGLYQWKFFWTRRICVPAYVTEDKALYQCRTVPKVSQIFLT